MRKRKKLRNKIEATSTSRFKKGKNELISKRVWEKKKERFLVQKIGRYTMGK